VRDSHVTGLVYGLNPDYTRGRVASTNRAQGCRRLPWVR